MKERGGIIRTPEETEMKFHTDEFPQYVNNARIEVTEDNVFIDFGIADPFALKEREEDYVASRVRSRIVMNRSTFRTLTEHIIQIREVIDEKEPTFPNYPGSVMSRCPSPIDG